MVILQCEKVSRTFGGLTALESISFSVNEGEILGLIGPNGAGKTTLFNVIAGLYKPNAGKIRFKDKIISGLSPHNICKQGVARTFQIPQPFKGLTVLENVMVGLLFGTSKTKKVNAAMRLIELVGLNDQADTLVENLTIANQKRIEICKALATNPELLLLDEVAAGLNPAEQDKMVGLINNIHGSLKISIIMVEHIMRTVMGLSHRVLVLEMGRVLTMGVPEEVRNDKKVIEAYLGEDYYEYAEG